MILWHYISDGSGDFIVNRLCGGIGLSAAGFGNGGVGNGS